MVALISIFHKLISLLHFLFSWKISYRFFFLSHINSYALFYKRHMVWFCFYPLWKILLWGWLSLLAIIIISDILVLIVSSFQMLYTYIFLYCFLFINRLCFICFTFLCNFNWNLRFIILKEGRPLCITNFHISVIIKLKD